MSVFPAMTSNGLHVSTIVDFGALHGQPSINVDRITVLVLATYAPISQTSVKGRYSIGLF
jgi:hypothetical protein